MIHQEIDQDFRKISTDPKSGEYEKKVPEGELRIGYNYSEEGRTCYVQLVPYAGNPILQGLDLETDMFTEPLDPEQIRLTDYRKDIQNSRALRGDRLAQGSSLTLLSMIQEEMEPVRTA